MVELTALLSPSGRAIAMVFFNFYVLHDSKTRFSKGSKNV